jgi:hypothetical protein
MPERHPGWVDGIDAAEARLATGLFTWPAGTGDQLDPLRPRTGLRDSPGFPGKVTLGSNKVTVNPFQAVVADLSRPDTGPYLVTLDAAKDLPIPAADQSNARIDLVVVTVDPAVVPGWAVQLLAGTPAPSPQPPTVPVPTALPLAQLSVPAVGKGAPTVQDLRRFTATTGGILPVTNAAGMPGAAPSSAFVYRLDTKTLMVQKEGVGWTAYSPPAGSIDGWHGPTFQNGWINYGAQFPPAGYTLTGDGWVRLRGLIKAGTATAPMFTLPVGYRPLYQHLYVVKTSGSPGVARIDITTAGVLGFPGGSDLQPNPGFVSLDGVAFPTY